jgi:hypothetical protein
MTRVVAAAALKVDENDMSLFRTNSEWPLQHAFALGTLAASNDISLESALNEFEVTMTSASGTTASSGSLSSKQKGSCGGCGGIGCGACLSAVNQVRNSASSKSEVSLSEGTVSRCFALPAVASKNP